MPEVIRKTDRSENFLERARREISGAMTEPRS